MEAVNACRFIGKLKSFSTSIVGGDGLLLGKGIIFLPDPENNNIGQNINITAWDETANKLGSLELGSWITVISSYMPSTFRGQLQDTFNVTNFIHHE